MNILFILGRYPDDGGVAKVTTVLAEGLKERCNNVYIGSFQQSQEDAIIDTCQGVPLLSLVLPITNKSNITLLNRFIKERDIKIIVCQWATDFRVSKLCRSSIRGTKCKIVTVLHTAPGRTHAIQETLDHLATCESSISRYIFNVRLYLLQSIARKSLQWTYDNSHILLSLSPSLLEDVRKFLKKRNGKKLGYIFNPITISEDKTSIEKENLVLFVGRLDNKTKKVNRILEVWNELGCRKEGWKLILVGDGPDREALEQYTKENGLPNVEFAGFSDPKGFYQKAKIILLTSGYEGFPLVLGEAMAYGVVPVVLGSFTSVKDIIDNSKNGIIIDMPFDVFRFSESLSSLICDQSIITALSKEAERKSHKFLLKTVLDSWETLFGEITK